MRSLSTLSIRLSALVVFCCFASVPCSAGPENDRANHEYDMRNESNDDHRGWEFYPERDDRSHSEIHFNGLHVHNDAASNAMVSRYP